MFRIRHYEFWNSHIFHLPIYLYWLYLSVKARSLFFFSAANPSIETGGLIGESKYSILTKIPQRYLPQTVFFKSIPPFPDAMKEIHDHNITYPFVVKPDVGQGGWLIDLIRNEKELSNYLDHIKMPFMIQEYIDAPVEVGVLYYRFPDSERGVISSVALKELLQVTGDGRQSLLNLIRAQHRAASQLKRLQKSQRIDLTRIPEEGEVVKLSFVGNHSYGTAFRNANYLVTDKMCKVFDSLCKSIDGFYFGRFDIRCNSLEDLSEGNFKVLELNGVGAEPLDIFDPSEKLINAYKTAFMHWKVIYQISMQNRKSFKNIMRLTEAWYAYKNVIRIQKLHHKPFTIGN